MSPQKRAAEATDAVADITAAAAAADAVVASESSDSEPCVVISLQPHHHSRLHQQHHDEQLSPTVSSPANSGDVVFLCATFDIVHVCA
jgi:hypothetical protein